MAKKHKRSIPTPQGYPAGNDSFDRSAIPGYPTVDKDTPLFPQLMQSNDKPAITTEMVVPTVVIPALLVPNRKGKKGG